MQRAFTLLAGQSLCYAKPWLMLQALCRRRTGKLVLMPGARTTGGLFVHGTGSPAEEGIGHGLPVGDWVCLRS